jgi:hypothetical protein
MTRELDVDWIDALANRAESDPNIDQSYGAIQSVAPGTDALMILEIG